ncbi:MAG: DUF3784 domain-containing protein [Bacteroidales bacterium]
MDFTTVLVGLIMIGVGFLVKFSPSLIAGYNTMPKDKKKNVDIKGLSTFLRNGLIAMGTAVIAGFYLFKWLGFTSIANVIIPIVTLPGVIVLLIGAQKYDHNRKSKARYLFMWFVGFGLIILFVVGLITYAFIPSKVSYDNDAVRFSGMYGFKVNISEIETVELTDELPSVRMRVNGFSLGSVNKGFFNVDDYGRSRLILHSARPPFLILKKNNGDIAIINFSDRANTENTYNRLNKLLNK